MEYQTQTVSCMYHYIPDSVWPLRFIFYSLTYGNLGEKKIPAKTSRKAGNLSAPTACAAAC